MRSPQRRGDQVRRLWDSEARAAAKADADAREAKRYEEEERQRVEKAFNNSPAGRARRSFLRNDLLFQININLNDVTSIDVPTGVGIATRRAADTSEVINSIIAEGWDFHAFSTTFVIQSESSQDTGPTSRKITVQGRLVGTYIFTRRPQG